MGELPFVDEHATRIAAPRDVVWPALQRYVERWLRAAEDHPLTRVLGTEPRAGFAIAERVAPERLALAGRHRFARYRLVFELADAPGGATELRALTFAAFPGARGRVYRLLVIGTRGHVLATRHLLRGARRASLRAAERAGGPDATRSA
jgi:hypothetical protein